jgi:co-chaperonin GroES (HSP10)
MKDRSSRGMTLSDAEFDGNQSGWHALDYKVFVKKDEVQEKTEGGIIMPEDARKQEEWNVQTGIVVSCGDMAFTDGRRADGELYTWAVKPKPGDRVITKEFAGLRFIGDDGNPYMVFHDKEIAGIKL